MKGQQTLELNQACVTEALSEYLNRHFVTPVQVISVAIKSNYGHSFTLEVQFEQFEQPERPLPPLQCLDIDSFGDRCRLSQGHAGPHAQGGTLFADLRER